MRYDLVPARTALLVIDMQNDFLLSDAPLASPHASQVIEQLGRVVERCRDMGAMVVFTAAVFEPDGSDAGRWVECWSDLVNEDGVPVVLLAGTPGVEVHDDIRPLPGEPLIRKNRYSALFNTELDSILTEHGIDTLVIGGVDTDICCESTAREAMFRTYKVLFLSDATATLEYPDTGWGVVSSEEAHRVALVRLSQAFCEVLSTDDFLERTAHLARESRDADQVLQASQPD